MDIRHERVGVVGTGAMGAPIVGHLARADREVTVLDRDFETARRIADECGAAVAEAAAELAATCAVVLVVVDNDAAVLEVASGLLGGTDGTALQAVLVCSTVSPATAQALQERADAAGVGLLDAAMIGGIRGVESGTIALLVGGSEEVLDAVRPAVEPWTAAVHHLGPLGAGQVAKSANNLIHWAQVCAIEEALRVVESAGLSVPAVRSALFDGPADSRALHELEQMRLTWWHKDLAGFRELAIGLGVEHRVSDLCADVMPGISVDSLAELLRAGG